MRPLGRGAAGGIGALAFAAILAVVLAGGSWRGDFRVDEAFKVSETSFLGLWMHGDVRNPAWFTNIVDRINPPAGKYALGVPIVLSGQQLPPFPTIAVRDPSIAALSPPALSAPYRPLLHAARSASIISAALTAALLAAMLARYHGWLSAVFAVAFFALSDVTRTHWASAVFDPMLALCFAMSVAFVSTLAAAPSTRRVSMACIAIGVVTALAFQTRLNGLFAFLVAVPFLWLTLHRTILKAILGTVIATVAFVATTLALNPYYWSTPAIPLEPFSSHHGPMRPVERLRQQQRDIMELARPVRDARAEGRTLAEKAWFLLEIMMSRLSDLLMMFAALTGAILLAVRWRSVPPALRVALLMSLAIVATMIATLPMPWPRYLLVVVPPLALVAGFATAEVLQTFIRAWRRASNPSAPLSL